MLNLSLIFAAISAGLIGGIHCVGMCGGMASLFAQVPKGQRIVPIRALSPLAESNLLAMPQSNLVSLHFGRLSTYMVVGAFFGYFGSIVINSRLANELHTWLFLIGNIALLFLGMRLLGIQVGRFLPKSFALAGQSVNQLLVPSLVIRNRHPYLLGLAWGALPCGLSYSIAPFALLSGAAWSGAALMFIFGIATLPHLLLAQTLLRKSRVKGWMRSIQLLTAISVITLAMLGLFGGNMTMLPGFLCISPSPSL